MEAAREADPDRRRPPEPDTIEFLAGLSLGAVIGVFVGLAVKAGARRRPVPRRSWRWGPGPLRLVVLALPMALAFCALTPVDLFAWGPGTHVAIGQAVLSSLELLPLSIRAILSQHGTAFLYGSVAADISFAKKYAPIGRHSHHWHVGEEIRASADSDRLMAVALGYLAHLAADTIAHNLFVPRQLLVMRTATQTVGHTYWEHRMDVHLGKRFGGLAREVVLTHDHSDADALFDRVLSRTLFSFRTNRRIFRGMIAFQDDDRWQQVFDEILRRSRFDLPTETRDRYVRLSFEYVMEYLADPDRARAATLDPIGDTNLKLARPIRREALSRRRADRPELLAEVRDQFFPLPNGPMAFLEKARGDVPGLQPLNPPDAASGDATPRRDLPSLSTPS